MRMNIRYPVMIAGALCAVLMALPALAQQGQGQGHGHGHGQQQGQAGEQHGQAGQPHGQAGQPHGQGHGQEHGKAGQPHGQAGQPHGQAGQPHGKAVQPLSLAANPNASKKCDLKKEWHKHTKRLAKLDRIAALAKEAGNSDLQAKAERIRQKEMRRHARVMNRCMVRKQVKKQGKGR